ncbi:MAG TPA: hypothetical protein ENN19_12840 [Chloroflexi bacterium]|nr:hypothetical protein [Chloroflexota bacterium]
MRTNKVLRLRLPGCSFIISCCSKKTSTPHRENEANPGATPIPPTPDVPRTPVPADVASPVVEGHSPRLGESLPLDGHIELRFDQAMDQEAVNAACTLQRAGSPPVEIAGAFTWIDERRLRFQPRRPLDRGTTYDVVLTQDAVAESGAPLRAPYRFRFQTSGYLDVAQVIPAPGAKDLEAKPTITVIFDQPVIPLTSLKQMEDLPHPLTFEPAIAGQGEWRNTSTYVFQPAQPLERGQTYTAIVAAGLESPQGVVLADDYVWQFSTKAPPPLKVQNTAPRHDASQVGIGTKIRVDFNYPVERKAAVAAFHMKSTGLFGPEVKGAFDVEGHTLIFTPQKPLNFDTTYEVKIAGDLTNVDDTAQMAEGFTWRFTTVPLPRIISTTPRDGEIEAHPYTHLEIKFNAPISVGTVLPNLDFTPPVSDAKLGIHFHRSDNTLYVNFGARPSTNYAVTIKNGITDPYGNRIPRGRRIRFRTADLPAQYRLHITDGIATYDASAPVRLLVSHRNVRRLDLRLYRFSPGSLSQLQREWRAVHLAKPSPTRPEMAPDPGSAAERTALQPGRSGRNARQDAGTRHLPA